MKTYLLGGIFLLFFAALLSPANASNALTDMSREMADLVERVGPAVIQVIAERDSRTRLRPPLDEDMIKKLLDAENRGSTAGSGFFVDEQGDILTTADVISGARRVIVILRGGRKCDAEVKGIDRSVNIAMLKADTTPPAVAKLGDSESLKPGSLAIAFGNPYGLSESVVWGVVAGRGRSGLGVREIENFIQLNASINPGDSGGPVLNAQGEVVGILTAAMGNLDEQHRAREGNSVHGIAFAIPINQVKELIPRLKAGGEIEHGWLGVGIQELTPALQAEFAISDGKGVLVATVVQSGPAQRAGVREGDVIRSFGGIPVKDPRELVDLVSKKAIGEKVALSVVRDGKERILEVEIGRPAARAGVPAEKEAESAADLGLSVQEVTPEIAAQLGIEGERYGIVVTDVLPGGPASRAGVRKGDLIYEMNRKRIGGLDDWSALISAVKAGQKFLVRTQRGFFVIKVE